MSLPPLTIGLLTYKRPWYAVNTLNSYIHKVSYDGGKKFVISDGGSNQEDLDTYDRILGDIPHEIVVSDNMSAQVNAIAARGGDLFLITVDDFMFNRRLTLNPDCKFLLENQDVGAIRMGRLAFWEHGPNEQIRASLRMLGGLHWWVFDKDYTNHPYICALNTTIYHRRFWDAYGDIEDVNPHLPGDAELKGASRYNGHPGPTIAIPMRFGQDCGDWDEPVAHVGCWRTDEYAAAGGGRRM